MTNVQTHQTAASGFAVIQLNWTGQSVESWQEILSGSQGGGTAGVGAVLHRNGLPKRLADALCHEANVMGTPLAQLKKVSARGLCKSLVNTKTVGKQF